jgi:hypothetical protein
MNQATFVSAATACDNLMVNELDPTLRATFRT